MRAFCLIALFFIAPLAAAETVYKQVDEAGNIIFSDNNTPDSEPVTVSDPQTVSIPKQSAPPAQGRVKLAEREYSLSITAPTNDQTLIDNTGTVNVSVSVSPSPRSGELLRVSMDGSEVSNQRSFRLSNVERGSHTLLAEVVDSDGRQLAASEPVTFHLKRHFIKPAAK